VQAGKQLIFLSDTQCVIRILLSKIVSWLTTQKPCINTEFETTENTETSLVKTSPNQPDFDLLHAGKYNNAFQDAEICMFLT
jgi:hypothetical protein